MSNRMRWTLAMAVAPYLLAAFVSLDLNPVSWDWSGRLFVGLFTLIFGVMTYTCPFIREPAA